jgi:hypothetical protein
LDFNAIYNQDNFVKILCLGLEDASRCWPITQAAHNLQIEGNVGLFLHHAHVRKVE